MGYVQDIYKQIYDYSGGSEFLLHVVGSNVIMFVTFWCINFVLLFVDLHGPTWLVKYKVQDYKALDPTKLQKAIRMALRNTLLFNPIVGVFIWRLQRALGCGFLPEDSPSDFWIVVDLLVFTLVQEFVFYYSHRLLHHPYLYKHVHKLHHEWTAPIGIVAIYAHPVEYLTSNLFTVLAGPVLARAHLLSVWIWYILATFYTVIHHSGYHFPFLPSPEFHDYHHLKFNWNFGTLGFLDRLHGTDKAFRSDMAKQRHRTLLGFTPMSHLYPDKVKAR